MSRDWPVAALATHNSIPFSLVFVNERRLASGEKLTLPMFAFGGTVVIETVFSYPGLGRLMFEAVGGRDFPVMQAGFLLITIAVLFFNLLADFMYQFLDPRTKRQ